MSLGGGHALRLEMTDHDASVSAVRDRRDRLLSGDEQKHVGGKSPPPAVDPEPLRAQAPMPSRRQAAPEVGQNSLDSVGTLLSGGQPPESLPCLAGRRGHAQEPGEEARGEPEAPESEDAGGSARAARGRYEQTAAERRQEPARRFSRDRPGAEKGPDDERRRRLRRGGAAGSCDRASHALSERSRVTTASSRCVKAKRS